MEDESIFPALVMKGRYSLRSFLERKKHIRRDKYFFTKKTQPKNIAVLRGRDQNQACHLENNRNGSMQAGSTGASSFEQIPVCSH